MARKRKHIPVVVRKQKHDTKGTRIQLRPKRMLSSVKVEAEKQSDSLAKTRKRNESGLKKHKQTVNEDMEAINNDNDAPCISRGVLLRNGKNTKEKHSHPPIPANTYKPVASSPGGATHSVYKRKRRTLRQVPQAQSPASLPQSQVAQLQSQAAQLQVQAAQLQAQAAQLQAEAEAHALAEAETEAEAHAQLEAEASQHQSKITKSVGDSTQKRKRGPTQCKDVYDMEPGMRIQVVLNEYHQPVGESARKLTQFCGSVARNGHNLPIDVFEWRKVPEFYKEKTWKAVLEKFAIPEEGKEWAMKNLNCKWREWKHDLMRKYHRPGRTPAQCPDKKRVVNEQWRNLVAHWNSDAYKKLSATNTANRKKMKSKHCAGTKSFARIAHEEREKTGVSMNPANLFIKTHTRKDGKPVDDISATVITQIKEIGPEPPEGGPSVQLGSARDDVLARVMGNRRRDRVRGLGSGPTPTVIWGNRPKGLCNYKLASDNKRLTQELGEVKEKFSLLEDQVKQIKEMFIKNQTPKDGGPPPPEMDSSVASYSSEPAEVHGATTPPNIATTSEFSPPSPEEDYDHIQPVACNMLSLGGRVVAQGYLVSEDPNTIVGDDPVGPGWCEVIIQTAVVPFAPLMKPLGRKKTVGEAEGCILAWVRHFIELKV